MQVAVATGRTVGNTAAWMTGIWLSTPMAAFSPFFGRVHAVVPRPPFLA
jgi:hypothetical protein